MQLNKRVRSLAASATLKFSMKAKTLRAQGVDIISFGAGEPDFPTPAHIADAGIKAIQDGKTRYTPSIGIIELREAIAQKLKRDNDLVYEPSQIHVTCGAKHAIFNVLSALCEPGDEVLIPAPYWVSYVEQVKACGGAPVIIDSQESRGFKITPEQLAAAVTPKSRFFIFNSPSNPTGAIYDEDECRLLAEVCLRHGLTVIADEIYEKLVYDGATHFSIAQSSPEMLDHCFVVNGLSKTYAMTGWRVGYVAGPKEIMAGMSRLQDHATSNINTPAQWAGLEAISGDQSCVDEFALLFDRRRQLALCLFEDIKGVTVSKPRGSFYLFPNVSQHFGRNLAGREIRNSEDFVEACLDGPRIACVPGSAFGKEGYIRISYATSDEHIEKGLLRMKEFLA
ncbi:pyridoxal phosphate-dependent aminotransferase [Planctomycetota bacterium]